ncbi:MAG: hypothetical protein AAGD06_34170 [Acidobacteriota bacterium]
MPLTLLAAALLSLTVLALAATGLYVLARKQRDHRRHLDGRLDELAASLHRNAEALDRRCDLLTEGLRRQALRQRIDHLQDLIRFAHRSGHLPEAPATALELYALDMAEEAREP